MARDLVWTDKNLKNFWDYYSDKEEEYFTEVFGDVIVKSFNQYLNNDLICVDYGCGTGGLVKALVSVGIKTIGIDYNQKSINNIKDNSYLIFGCLNIENSKVLPSRLVSIY